MIGGDLRVRGWAKSELKATGDELSVSSPDNGQTVNITCDSDCDLLIPVGSSIQIETIEGDAKITEVNGAVQIETIGGDLSVREVGQLIAETVGGDLHVRQVTGDARLNTIGGDGTLFKVKGNLHIDQVGGDAYIRDVDQDCIVETIGGDLILQIPFHTGKTYRVNAAGDLLCQVLPGTNAHLDITAYGEMSFGVESARAKVTRPDEQHAKVMIGTEGAQVQLTAHGDFQLLEEDSEVDFEEGFEINLDVDIDRIMEQTARAAERARRQAERIRDQIEREAERTAAEIRRQAERAASEAQREAERATAKSKRGVKFSWSWDDGKMKRNMGFPPPVPPVPPVPPMPPTMATNPSQPVTNEERLLILRMVESKQITVEQAEKLLAALEGKVAN
jgi:DUF4097 and DUF4098 domain-containing protein YvlB